MGAQANVKSINYGDQKEFDRFFATAFDKYDKNKDGKIDYNEFQPLVNEMCQLITQKYGYGPTVDKIRQAWNTMDKNKSGFITRQEFSAKAKREVEAILSQPQPGQGAQPGYGPQPGNIPQPGYGPQPGNIPQPGYSSHGHSGYSSHGQSGYSSHGYGPHSGFPPQQQKW